MELEPDLVGDAVTRESMATLRDDITDLQARLDETERGAERLPHRERNLKLVVGFLREYLELHLRLIDRVEQEMPAQPARSEAASR